MAEDRTDWAEDRTILANERTFAGWMRTGMAAVAVAIGLKAVFGDFTPTWMAKAVASLFLAAALYIFWSARQQAAATRDRMEARSAEPQSNSRMTAMAAILAFGTVAVGVILWLL
ncbi:YidH family protein [Oceaniovalibus guishaninsula]|nr:DUF202 domain-containing protein [Oceaniovalibus guishaninsula]